MLRGLLHDMRLVRRSTVHGLILMTSAQILLDYCTCTPSWLSTVFLNIPVKPIRSQFEANSTVDARLAVVSAEVRITEQVDSDRQASRGSFKVNRRFLGSGARPRCNLSPTLTVFGCRSDASSLRTMKSILLRQRCAMQIMQSNEQTF
jgi:hypothetical protein